MLRLSSIPIGEPQAWRKAQAGLDPLATQTWAYNRILAEGYGLPMELLVAEGPEGRATCALFRRPIGDGSRFDLATPVGFGGFAGAGRLPGLRDAWTEYWRALGGVSAYVQLHPLTGQGLLDGALSEFAADAGPASITVVLPLAGRSEDEILAGMRRDHRSRIRQWLAREAGFEVGHYALPEARLEDLTSLPECWMAGARGANGEIEAVSLFLFSATGADYHLNAARGEGRRHARALVWAAIQEAMRRGTPALHLSGGVQAGDSLDEFKSGFGGVRAPSLALRSVVDPQAYSALCRDAGVEASTAGFFPAYRRPRPG